MPQKSEYAKNYTKKNKKNTNSKNQNNNEIMDILNNIEKLDKLSDLDPKDYADIDGYADKIANNLSRKLNTNQLRKFFGAVRDIEKKKNWEEIRPELYLLKPKLAVSVGRNLIPKDFYKFMKITTSKIDVGENDSEKLENFDTFVKFLEAIVAYHKYYTH